LSGLGETCQPAVLKLYQKQDFGAEGPIETNTLENLAGHLELKLQQETFQGWASRANQQFRNLIERRFWS